MNVVLTFDTDLSRLTDILAAIPGTKVAFRTKEPLTPPSIGTFWPNQGGIYAGVVRGNKGQPDYHLIVANPAVEKVTWKDAGAWARGLQVGLHTDYDLPLRKEQAILFGNVPELFENDWYWSCEQFAGDAGYAWCQSFYYGLQSDNGTSYQLRARAVRRVIP